MEEDIPKRETRSRSKTPSTLRSSIDRDIVSDGEKKKLRKNPAVETILEEKDGNTPTANQRSGRTKRTSKAVTNEVSDGAANRVNKETAALIANSIAVVPQAIAASEQVVTKTTTVVSKRVISESTTQGKTTRASTREADQNESNLLLEKSMKLLSSTPNKKQNLSMNSSSGSLNDSTTNGIDLEDHAAFKEYKEAGEYWNKYPKTDYTYSKLSQQRREVKPGIIAMPNMSRRSLELHHQRVNDMIKRDPTQESFFRRRYEAFTALRNRKSTNNYYDSGDETDLSFTSITKTSFLRRIITVITTFFSTIYDRTTGIFRRKKDTNYYYYSSRLAQDQRGILRKSSDAVVGAVVGLFRYIYLCISSVLLLDTWLLRSSNATSGKKKGLLIGLLILLPLLLLGAYSMSDESDKIYYRERLNRLNVLPYVKSLPHPDFSSLPSVPSIDIYTTFDEFTTRTTHVIPLALALIKTQTSNVSDRLKYLFDFNWNWLPFYAPWSSRRTTHNYITNNIQSSLSPDEYQNVLNHINAYIETVVGERIQKLESEQRQQRAEIDPKLALYIATIVKEHVIHHKNILTDDEIERIAEILRVKFAHENAEKADKSVPFILSQENLEQITKLIKQNIEIHRHEWNIVNEAKLSGAERKVELDIDEILFKILTSSKLTDFVDQRLSQKIDSLAAQVKTNSESIDRLDRNFNSLKVEIDAKLSDLSDKHFAAIDQHIRNVLVEIIGFKTIDGKSLSNDEIKNWIQSVFVARDLLDARLDELSAKFDHRLDSEINRSSDFLIKEISEKIKRDVLLVVEQRQVYGNAATLSLNETRIKDIVREALAVYDADKTGMVDYALESGGGQVLSTRCTENFHVRSAQFSVFGIPLWYASNTPRSVISPSVRPGECWSFQGFPGYLVLKLSHNVYVTGFTMEHIPKSLSPSGKIDSAPKTFAVYGLQYENDQEPFLLGEYEFEENGPSLQYFAVQNRDKFRSHSLIELRIESNHGNINYTCLYRFRVHGTLSPNLI